MDNFIAVRILSIGETNKKIVLNINLISEVSSIDDNILSIKMNNNKEHTVFIDENDTLKKFKENIFPQ